MRLLDRLAVSALVHLTLLVLDPAAGHTWAVTFSVSAVLLWTGPRRTPAPD